MTATEKLRDWFLEKVPEASDDYPVAEDKPTPKLTISAMGGRHSVELDEAAFAKLVAQGGGILSADMTPAEMGRLLTAAKDHGPRHLLDALLSVRTPTSPVYLVRMNGRTWRPNATPPTNTGTTQ